MVAIRIMPTRVAQSKEYQGPRNTEQTILMKCAIGHIPSTRRMGEITTPRAISMDRVIIFSKLLELRILFFSFHVLLRGGLASLGRESIFPSHPETRVPIASYKIKGAPLPSVLKPQDWSSHFLSSKIKTGNPNLEFPVKHNRRPYVGIIQIRLWVEGDSFLSACQHKLPVYEIENKNRRHLMRLL